MGQTSSDSEYYAKGEHPSSSIRSIRIGGCEKDNRKDCLNEAKLILTKPTDSFSYGYEDGETAVFCPSLAEAAKNINTNASLASELALKVNNTTPSQKFSASGGASETTVVLQSMGDSSYFTAVSMYWVCMMYANKALGPVPQGEHLNFQMTHTVSNVVELYKEIIKTAAAMYKPATKDAPLDPSATNVGNAKPPKKLKKPAASAAP